MPTQVNMPTPNSDLLIRRAGPDDYAAYGQLLVQSYVALPGFPGPEQQPDYYRMLADVGQLTTKASVDIFVASLNQQVLGGVVYIGDMRDYGATEQTAGIRQACGIRLLAVHPASRGLGIGQALTEYCITQAKAAGKQRVVLHSTEAMASARRLYQRLGFIALEALNFSQVGLAVYGFQLQLTQPADGNNQPTVLHYDE